MSNTDFTAVLPEHYGNRNPLIGSLPADTADNLLYALAFLQKVDFTGFDHDESMGLFRVLEAMHGAAHHLRMEIEPERDDTVILMKNAA